MPAPCFESQAKEKLKLPPEVMYAFTDKLLEHIQSGRSYPEALDEMSKATGLQPETINSMYRRDPKAFSLTKQSIARAGRVRQLRDAADQLAGQMKTDARMYTEPGNVAKAWDLQRKLALSGHSVVFPWTHMRNWAIQIPTEQGRARMGAFWRAATDTYRYAGERGKALYEMDMTLLQKGDRYDFFKQSGADIVPGKRSPGDILLQDRKPSWQNRNFDTLKVARYTGLDRVWANVDPALREGDTGKAFGAMVARDMNYATGSVMPPVGEAANVMAKTGAQLSQAAGHYNLLMSSKLFLAKHMDAIFTPLRYAMKTGRMTSAERGAANIAMGRWANTVTTHLAILGANYAFNKAMGWQTPNLTDPTKSDFLRIRLGNFVVPFSPILESIRLPIVITAASLTKGEGGQKAWLALWNAAHPTFHTGYEQVTGKDFMGRPIPGASIRGQLAQHGLAPAIKSKKPPIGGLEYATTRFTPIAISGALREYYQALRDHGLEASMAMNIVKGLAAGAASGLAGTHLYEQEPQAQQSSKRGGPQAPRR